MGITGLLPALKSVTHQVHIAKYAGKTVGIDAAGWLYRGAYSCAKDVVLRTKNADGYLNYCLDQIKLLQEHDVTPIFVFDGAHLPAKADINAVRNRNRQVWKTKAMRQLNNGDESASYTAFTKAVSVSNDMVMRFIAVLRRMHIAFIIAPYEADAQLAYMSRHKIVDVVVSEDSDCVPYGCKTMLFKWSPDGWASELKRRSLGANEELSFVGWTEEMFIELCVLCGCDYCPSIAGVGIVTAYKLVEMHKKPIQVVQALQEQKKAALPTDYAQRFYAAIITFRHHLVFDPRDKRLKMLNPLTLSHELLPLVDKELHFLGDMELRDDVAALIASGDVHPVTLEHYDWTHEADEQQQQPQQQRMQSTAYLASQPSARSMTSTESSTTDRRERTRRVENDGQSHRSSSVSQLDAYEPVATNSDHLRSARTNTGSSNCSSNAHAQRDVALQPSAHEQCMDHEQPRAASTSWSHLDSVLGASVHILNFRSPKVSDNFRPLVSLSSNAAAALATTTTATSSCNGGMHAFAHQAVRQSSKRVANPSKRVCVETSRSGFSGEVRCHVDTSRPPAVPAKAKTSARDTHAVAVSESQLDVESESAPAARLPLQPSVPLASSLVLKRPRPFATAVVTEEAPSHDVAADCASECSWTAHSSCYSRATRAEEKWDRILGDELDESNSSSSSSPGPSATPCSNDDDGDDASHATSQTL